MIISHRYKFIFIKTVKTAGTSTEVYLNKFLGPEDVATPVFPAVDGFRAANYRGRFNPIPEILARGPKAIPRAFGDLIKGRRYYNHLPAYKVRARVGEEVWNRYFTFCVERNPWDKMVSYFSMRNVRSGGALSWEEFVAGDQHCNNLLHYVEPRDRTRPIVDRILRFESLDQDLSEVFDRLGIPFSGSLEVRAKSGYRSDPRDYREWYDKEQRKRVARVFAEEIQLLGYAFDESTDRAG